MRSILRKCALTVLAFGTIVAIAQAHRPGTLQADTTVSNPYVSWVFPGVFETGDELFILRLNMERAFATPFEIFVPRQEAYREFRPQYAIVGPGLPKPSRQVEAHLPKPLPEGAGVYYEANDKPEREVFFEQVMRRSMWSSGTIAIPLRKGNYQIWIWSKEKQKGKFQFGFGVEEKFDGEAFTAIFSNWGLYAY